MQPSGLHTHTHTLPLITGAGRSSLDSGIGKHTSSFPQFSLILTKQNSFLGGFGASTSHARMHFFLFVFFLSFFLFFQPTSIYPTPKREHTGIWSGCEPFPAVPITATSVRSINSQACARVPLSPGLHVYIPNVPFCTSPLIWLILLKACRRSGPALLMFAKGVNWSSGLSQNFSSDAPEECCTQCLNVGRVQAFLLPVFAVRHRERRRSVVGGGRGKKKKKSCPSVSGSHGP